MPDHIVHVWPKDVIEAAARAYYMADKEVTEADWDAAHRLVKDEYRKAVRIVLLAARKEADRLMAAAEIVG